MDRLTAMETTTPSTTFGQLPELLCCLAEVVQSRSQLAALCLVSKSFNAAATPVLYRECSTDNHRFLSFNPAQAQMERGLDSPFTSTAHQKHIRSLVIRDYISDDIPDVVQSMLPQMPLLEAFSWRCAPLPVDLLSKLHACCPNIKAIHLWFLPTAGSDRTQLPDGRLRYAKPDLAAFSGLEELTLDSMFGDLPWWRSQVVRVLANSPRLRGLHLSIGYGALFSCARDGRRDQFEGFLDRLCDEYSVEAAAPLRLRSLHLGHAIVPSRPGALARLTDLACLEDVYVSNCAVLGDGSDEFEIYGARGNQGRTTRVDWPVFGPRSCPRLARFNVVRYSGEVHALLAAMAAQDASFVRRLAVSCLEMDRAHGGPGALLRPDPRYPSLPVHVRMVEIDLYQGGDKDVGAEAVLRSVVEGDDGALEGLVVRLGEQFEETPASGDGDEQPGRPPQRVFPAVEFELLIGAVAGLANLTQLAVDWTGIFWNGVDGEGLPALACRLAAAAPRLRYVKVRDIHWRVGRGRAGETNGAIGLERLRMRTPEFNQVELFRGSIWAQKIYHREYRP